MSGGAVIWICGLSGSGKTTIAKELVKKLKTHYDNVIFLDGDFLREIYNDFDYTRAGRLRIALQSSKLCKKLSDEGSIVVFSVATMLNELFEYNRNTIENYYEILIECPFEELVRRDQKGLYSSAIKGDINNVWGVDLEVEFPKADYIVDNRMLDGLEEKVEYLFQEVLTFLDGRVYQCLENRFIIKNLNTYKILKESYPLMQNFRPYLTLDFFIQQVFYQIKTMKYRLFGFFEENTLVALCGVMPFNVLYRKKCLLLCDLIVDEKCRRQGLGRLVVGNIENIAKNEGYNEIALESGISRSDAHRFYMNKMCFEKVGFSFKKQLFGK